MKIVIAPDSYKNCMRSQDVCEALKEGILSVLPDSEVMSVPMADGGEGTTESAVFATGGALKKVTCTGPLGTPVEAQYGVMGNAKIAVMEMASASGIELLSREQLNPMEVTTFGTGELIRQILEDGFRDIIIGIGGSATVDGGAGMAQALGFAFKDINGNDVPRGGKGLPQIASINTSGVDPRLTETRFRVACDVTNPLLGENGAAHVFGPQKGATPAMVEQLEQGLANFADCLIKAGLISDACQPGDGAAGGLGTGLRAFCRADVVSGAQLLIELNGLEEKLADANLLITGEGCTDSQTSSGKLCAVISETAKKHNVPVILVSGAINGAHEALKPFFDASFSVATGPGSLDDALAATPDNLKLMGQNIAAMLNLRDQ